MKLFLKTLTFLILGSLAASSYAMQQQAEPSFNLFARNLLNRRIKISWLDREGTIQSKLVASTTGEPLMKYDDIKVGSQLKIESYGDYVGYTSQALEIPKASLAVSWQELGARAGDTLVLSINSSYIYYLTVNYSIKTKEEAILAGLPEKNFSSNPLSVFKNLSITYPHVAAALTYDKILGFQSPADIVIPATTRFQKPTTVEDVYRYMLGLSPDYTEKNVKRAYKSLVTEYHPDKFSDRPDGKEFAQKIFILLTKAKDGLLKAIEHKELGGEWVDLQPGWQPDSPRKESPRKEESASSGAIVIVKDDGSL